MHGRSAIWFPLALLALLAALTFWIDRTVQPPQPRRDGTLRHDPDYTVKNFVMTKSDHDGNPLHALTAVSMVHFPDDDSTELTRPRFTQFSELKPATQIQAQRGLVSSNGDNVYFMDNVKAVRAATANKGELTILTEYLHIIPDQEIALTDRPVSILQAPHTVITAIGMVLNKKLRTVKLLQHVRVHYERPGVVSGAPATTAPVTKKPKAATQKVNPRKPQTQTTKTVAGKPQGRIRRHYETPTYR
jgi:lipopolysaccharide export system protein LptC